MVSFLYNITQPGEDYSAGSTSLLGVGLLKRALVNILCCNSFPEVVSANFDQVQTVHVNAVLSPPVLALPV